tara:strand:+ start:322 stop:507 length:186 start_codon:yes stop_codon:yes gene_type:complete
MPDKLLEFISEQIGLIFSGGDQANSDSEDICNPILEEENKQSDHPYIPSGAEEAEDLKIAG